MPRITPWSQQADTRYEGLTPPITPALGLARRRLSSMLIYQQTVSVAACGCAIHSHSHPHLQCMCNRHMLMQCAMPCTFGTPQDLQQMWQQAAVPTQVQEEARSLETTQQAEFQPKTMDGLQ